ncbi:MAG: hypothetical protein U1F57_09535 [bacterium]
MRKKLLLLFLLLMPACTNNGVPNILLLPKYLSIDAANGRLFVVDAANNNFSLITLSDNKIVTGAPLLNKDSTLLIPQLPQDIAAVNIGNGVSRIFLIGNSPPPRNIIEVLEYDSTNGLRLSPISPITVGTDGNALLGGLTFDASANRLYVTSSADNQVFAYNTADGTPVAGTPVSVNGAPTKMGLNPAIHRLFVSSLDGNSITALNTLDLTTVSLDVGLETSSVASATNTTGTILFALNPSGNQINVFTFDPNANTVTAFGSPVVAPAPGQAAPANNVLTGAATQVLASVLPSGVIAGLITQSTGDLGFIDVAADFSGFNQGLVTVLNGLGANGIDVLNDANGNGSAVYFAAPGGGAVSYVNIVTNQFVGQIL